jgi:hypothetical protein
MYLPLNSRHAHRRSAVQWLLGFAAAFMMMIGQSAAVGAVPSGGGAWIEICGAGGTKLVQTEDESPADACGHCAYCAVQFSSPSAGAPAFHLFGPAPAYTDVQFIAVRRFMRPGAEQYWAANRGPPLASEETMNTLIAFLAVMTPAALWGTS